MKTFDDFAKATAALIAASEDALTLLLNMEEELSEDVLTMPSTTAQALAQALAKFQNSTIKTCALCECAIVGDAEYVVVTRSWKDGSIGKNYYCATCGDKKRYYDEKFALDAASEAESEAADDN